MLGSLDRVPVSRFEPEGAAIGVVLALHGFADYARNFELAARDWTARGYLVIAVDQKGFGRRADAGEWPGVSALMFELPHMITAVKSAHPELPLHLVGASMGAGVILASLGERDYRGVQSKVQSIVLAAPAVWGWRLQPFVYRASLSAARRVGPGWSFSGRGLEIQTTDNIEYLRTLAGDPYMQREAPVRALYGMAKLMDRALENAPFVKVPALIVYGLKDEVIPAEAIACLARLTPAPLLTYQDSYHLILRDKGRGAVLDDIAAFWADPRAYAPRGDAKPDLPDVPPRCTNSGQTPKG